MKKRARFLANPLKNLGFLPTFLPLVALACAADDEKQTLDYEVSSNDFTIIGEALKGEIMPKSDLEIDSRLELRYLVYDVFPNDDTLFTINHPNSLINSDKVWIKPFVKPEFSQQYTINAKAIMIEVATLQKHVISLEKNFFVVEGSTLFGTVNPLYDAEQALAGLGTIRYYVGMSRPNSDERYSWSPPENLKNGDRVWVKFFAQDYKNFMGDEAIVIEINSLSRTTLVLTPNDFFQKGASFNGTLELETNKNMQLFDLVDLRYNVGASMPSSEIFWQSYPPLNLKNGDRVWVKMLNRDPINYDVVPPFSFEVQELRKINLAISLQDFIISGKAGQGRVTLNPLKQALISGHATVKYCQDETLRWKDEGYLYSSLENLSNNKVVYARLFLHDRSLLNYEVNNESIAIEVKNLTRNLISIQAEDFIFSGQSQQGQVALSDEKAREISGHAQITYFIGQIVDDASQFLFESPSNLKNQMKMWVLLKNLDEDNYQVETTPLPLIVSGLTKTRLEIKARDFTLVGRAYHGEILVNTSIESTLFAKARLKYFVGASYPLANEQYSVAAPIALKNGDRVWIIVDIIDRENYDFGLPLVIDVELLPLISFNITSKDFTVEGDDRTGTVTISQNKFNELAIYGTFSYGLSDDQTPISYQTSAISNAKNGQNLYVKFAPIDAKNVQTIHDLKIFEVTTLTSKKTINIGDFYIAWQAFYHKFKLREDESLDSRLEVRYFVGATMPSAVEMTNIPQNVHVGDRVWYALFTKPGVTSLAIPLEINYFDVVSLQ